MSVPAPLTPNEAAVIELLRQIKANRGHGTLRVEITAGVETLFRPERSVIPPSARLTPGVDNR